MTEIYTAFVEVTSHEHENEIGITEREPPYITECDSFGATETVPSDPDEASEYRIECDEEETFNGVLDNIEEDSDCKVVEVLNE